VSVHQLIDSYLTTIRPRQQASDSVLLHLFARIPARYDVHASFVAIVAARQAQPAMNKEANLATDAADLRARLNRTSRHGECYWFHSCLRLLGKGRRPLSYWTCASSHEK